MTALCILLGIAVLLLLILFCPVTFDMAFKEDFKFCVKAYGIKVYSSDKEKKPKKKDEKKPESKETSEKKKKENKLIKTIKAKSEKQGVMKTAQDVLKVIKAILEKMAYIIKKIRFYRFDMCLVVADEDAAKTAINYGIICTAVYPVLSMLDHNTSFGIKHVDISADFNKTAIEFSASIRLKLCVIYVFVAGVKAIKEYRKMKKEGII